ncbi:MAG: hypothetical protein QOJ70_2193 [Acidobacteriota bacterium]|jgi:hypothetical protein|nr:hypothetical protein [Acidobacteriota bacterium]
MKKLAGLLAFAVALGGAILLTKYYAQKYAPPTPPPPVQTGLPAATPAHDPGAQANAPVTLKPQLVTLDLAGRKAHVALTLERDPARPSPATVWVWAYFFSTDAPGRYCAGEPVEVRQPFASGNGRSSITVDLPVKDCPAPRAPSSTYYARVNVSSESAFAARLTEQRISYDITQASPVVVEGAGAKQK